MARRWPGTYIYTYHILANLPSTSNPPGKEKNTSGVKEKWNSNGVDPEVLEREEVPCISY